MINEEDEREKDILFRTDVNSHQIATCTYEGTKIGGVVVIPSFSKLQRAKKTSLFIFDCYTFVKFLFQREMFTRRDAP